MTEKTHLDYYDFFAGGGMARLGLGDRWRCLMANDMCPKKANAYRMNFPPADELIERDIHKLTIADLPGRPAMAWASFPCQDLSLAGNRNGLDAKRSGTFWPFWKLMVNMDRHGRPVPIIVLENVVGALTSNQGRDIHALLEAIAGLGYRFGAMVIDAVHFLPQSRPRLFIIGVRDGQTIPVKLMQGEPCGLWHSNTLKAAYHSMSDEIKSRWIWWRLPEPTLHKPALAQLIEETPTGVVWHTPQATTRLLGMMSEKNIEKVRQAQALGRQVIGTVYKRTRRDKEGNSAQRAEVRFDQISGCLRTSIGGSSRQTVIVVNGDSVRSRLLSPREASRLMGVPDTYRLPDKYNEAYHLMGDGLAVPVVSWIAKHLLHPLATANKALSEAA
jgi:DNA (cytosine-5)-methyltransferase 1